MERSFCRYCSHLPDYVKMSPLAELVKSGVRLDLHASVHFGNLDEFHSWKVVVRGFGRYLQRHSCGGHLSGVLGCGSSFPVPCVPCSVHAC